VIGLRAGVAGRALDGVQAAHLTRLPAHAAGGGKVADVPHRAGHRPQEVRVERHHHPRFVEGVPGVDDLAERHLRAGPHVVAAGGLELMPSGRGEGGQEFSHLPRQRGRGHGAGENAQPGAPAAPLGFNNATERSKERAPGANIPLLFEGLRPVRVVQGQDLGLGEHVRGAEAGWMPGVPLDLRRTALVALHQHARRVSAERHGRGIEERLAGNELLGSAHVRHDHLGRLLRTGRHAGERQRRAHQPQELPPPDRIRKLGRLRGELPVEILLEGIGVGQFFETAPVLRAGRAGQAGLNRSEIEFVMVAHA